MPFKNSLCDTLALIWSIWPLPNVQRPSYSDLLWPTESGDKRQDEIILVHEQRPSFSNLMWPTESGDKRQNEITWAHVQRRSYSDLLWPTEPGDKRHDEITWVHVQRPSYSDLLWPTPLEDTGRHMKSFCNFSMWGKGVRRGKIQFCLARGRGQTFSAISIGNILFNFNTTNCIMSFLI